MTRSTKAKYRPPLSNAQITHILELAKMEKPYISQLSMSVIATLVPFQAKIDNDCVAAAYTTSDKPKLSDIQALGGTTTGTGGPVAADLPNDFAWAASSNTPTGGGDGGGTKEQYWEACFKKTKQHGYKGCSLAEIQAANEHRYINDLMSPEEEEHHELSTNTKHK